MNYKDIAQNILKKTGKAADEAEVFLVSSRSTHIDILDQEIESCDILENAGFGIRIVKDKKLGFSFSSEFDDRSIDETIKRAVSSSKEVNPDEFNGLPSPSYAAPIPDMYDIETVKTPIIKKIELAKKVEKEAYNFDKRIKKTEKVAYGDVEYEMYIVNSKGVNVEEKGTTCEAFAEVIAQDNGNAEEGFGVSHNLKLKELDPKKVGVEAAQRAVELLGAKSVESQKISLVLDPFIGVELLETIVSMLSADAVQKGKSLFANKLAKKVASTGITIIDDGRLAGGIASSPYDAEGVPTQRTELIKNGILSSYIYNVYAANKDKRKSTGNAARGSFKSLPGIGCSNLFFEKGTIPAEKIIADTSKGLYVTKVLGMHTVNPISGDFSIGASGIFIENGVKTFPVRGITIAGNLAELLNSIEAVGSDLRFFSSVGSPTLLISGITISG